MSITIKEMKWIDAGQTSVALLADTPEGNDLQISTPYSYESIFWDDVSQFPADQIQAYEPVVVEDPQLNQDQLLAIIDALETKVPGIKNFINTNIR
jgi:hypothetical protein